MAVFQKFMVKQYAKGLLFKNGNFVSMLEPGEHNLFAVGQRFEVVTYDINAGVFEHPIKDYLIAKRPAVIAEHFSLVQTDAAQIAVVKRDGVILEIVPPNTRALFWRGFVPLEVEHLNVADGLSLANDHVLLARKSAGWVQKFFTDVAPTDGSIAIVSRSGTISNLIVTGERKLYWRDLEVMTFVQHNVLTNVPKAFQDAIVAANPNWLEKFLRLELGEFELGLVRRGKAIADLIPPTMSAMYFNDGVTKLETVNIANDFLVRADIAANLKGTKLEQYIENVTIPEYHTGALFKDGKLEGVLEVGAHAFWKIGRALRVAIVDSRLQTLEVSGQEILTKDKVALRLNLSTSYRVTDAILATSKLKDLEAFLYKELQLGLRAAVGTRTLDALLEDKDVLDNVVFEHVKAKTEGFGLAVDSVGVKDIILPGEMKAILSKVVEAEKVAQANGIRRREETAATRSLLNTAKVMEDNPVALRLKELETLERITENIDQINISNGLDGLLRDLVKINN
jgi:regulator of protease activity HflC (stomatin/prohibitin superfamily)